MGSMGSMGGMGGMGGMGEMGAGLRGRVCGKMDGLRGLSRIWSMDSEQVKSSERNDLFSLLGYRSMHRRGGDARWVSLYSPSRCAVRDWNRNHGSRG